MQGLGVYRDECVPCDTSQHGAEGRCKTGGAWHASASASVGDIIQETWIQLRATVHEVCINSQYCITMFVFIFRLLGLRHYNMKYSAI